MKREKKPEKKRRRILPLILFLALGITIFLGWEKKRSIEKNISLEEIAHYPDQEVEVENEVQQREEVVEKVIVRPRITRGEIVDLILQKGEAGIAYTLIEIDGSEVNISGETDEIEDVYRLESELRSEGAEKINSDYIKKEGEKIGFKMDFNLQNYREKGLQPYLPERRRIFATPTEQRTVLSRMVSRRCEIISIGRSQKLEFSGDIMETGIPYHIRGDLHQILNLFFDIEESWVFLSLMEDPIKIIITGDVAEVYFKVTGYSGSFS
ncbi:MAG: hypothetical protein ACRCU6_02465 [Fusobacteriaceae bacterium]